MAPDPLTESELEALRCGIALRSAPGAAVTPGAAGKYVKAVMGSSTPSHSLAAAACAANAVVAGASNGPSFVDAFTAAGGPGAAVARCRRSAPALAFVALVKIIHIVAATNPDGQRLLHTPCEALATILHWVLDTTCGGYVYSSSLALPHNHHNDGDRVSDDRISHITKDFFLGANADDPEKGRDKERLANELLSACYALTIHGSTRMLRNGMLISAMLRLVSKRAATIEVFELQVAALRLMMLAPSLAPFDDNIIVKKILFILKLQLWRYAVEKSCIHAPDRDIAPFLRVAQALYRANPSGPVKRIVFPPVAESVWRAKFAKDRQHARYDPRFKANFDTRRFHPADAPPFALRTVLFHLQTDIHAVVKRFTNEFLFDLCERNVQDFTLRCGIGNAIAFLQVHQGGVGSV